MRKGFTLIELLVVVLIIGILAAIALPQYEVAVLKARYTQALAVLGTLRNAEEIYYLANGHYVDDTTVLDVGDLSGCTSPGIEGMIICDDFSIDVNAGNANGNPVAYLQERLAYAHYQDHSAVKPGVRECWAKLGDKKAEQVCLSFGGVKQGQKSINVFGGTVTVYQLP